MKDYYGHNAVCRGAVSTGIIANNRLVDMLRLPPRGGRQREHCFFTALFALGAGYSEGAADDMAAAVSAKYAAPLGHKDLQSVVRAARKNAKGKVAEYYYANRTLANMLLPDADEAALALSCIMTEEERRRRVSVRNHRYYVQRRGGVSKKDKIQSRRRELAALLLGRGADRRAFCEKHGISRRTYYTDLAEAKLIAARMRRIRAEFSAAEKSPALPSNRVQLFQPPNLTLHREKEKDKNTCLIGACVHVHARMLGVRRKADARGRGSFLRSSLSLHLHEHVFGRTRAGRVHFLFLFEPRTRSRRVLRC